MLARKGVEPGALLRAIGALTMGETMAVFHSYFLRLISKSSSLASRTSRWKLIKLFFGKYKPIVRLPSVLSHASTKVSDERKRNLRSAGFSNSRSSEYAPIISMSSGLVMVLCILFHRPARLLNPHAEFSKVEH